MAINIPLLNPVVLNRVVSEFTTPESKPLLASLPRTPSPENYATWDVVRGSRAVARPNVPNSEAHIIDRLGRSQGQATFANTREKKVFSPTTTMWIRKVGSLSEVGRVEDAILREVNDLNERADNYAEYLCWQALTGAIYDARDNSAAGGTTITVAADFNFLATHKPSSVATSWATATPAQIVADVRAWKRLVEMDGRVPATDAWTSSKTVDYIVNSFAFAGVANTFMGGSLLSDRMKDEFFSTGQLTGFMGLNWHTNDSVYDPNDTAYTANPSRPNQDTQFLLDKALVIGNFSANRPMELIEGPTADFSAGQGHIGKFTKTWRQEDPSGEQVLLDWNFLPVITRPDQFVYVADLTDTTP